VVESEFALAFWIMHEKISRKATWILTKALIMKCSLALCVLAASVSLAGGAETSKAVPIFDGKTFRGWEGDTNKTWRIENGAFAGGTLKEKVAHNEFISTTRGYTNFVLRLKFKLVGTEGFVNGGVQVRSQRISNPAFEMSGYQIDVGDPEWWGCIYDESRRNKVVAKSDMNEVNKVLKRNDWNDYVIRCEGKRIRVSLNGYQTVDYTEPDNSIPQHGLIAVQVHGGGKAEASYKDISVEELP
jgi:hypothetical protein